MVGSVRPSCVGIADAGGFREVAKQVRQAMQIQGWNERLVKAQWDKVKDIAQASFAAHPACERASDGAESGSVSVPDSSRQGLNRRCWAEAMVEADGPLPLAKALHG